MKATYRRIIEQYIAAYNQFDVVGMTAHLSDEVVFENINNGEATLRTEGLAAFTQQAETAKIYFISRRQQIRSWIFEGDTVKVEIDYNGVLAIDLPNGLKVGEQLRLHGTSTFQFRADKIVRITDVS